MLTRHCNSRKILKETEVVNSFRVVNFDLLKLINKISIPDSLTYFLKELICRFIFGNKYVL